MAAVAVALLGVISSCSAGSSDGSSSTLGSATVPVAPSTAPATTLPPTTTSPPPTTTTEPPTSTTADYSSATWEQVTAPSQCMCADGSPYRYWIRKADPTKVVFFLQGGGACFDASTCAFDSGAYKVDVADDETAKLSGGIFDFADPRNPLADYSFVFAPYCTGDLHLGTATHEYGPQLTVHHNGSVNATTALDDLAAQFPAATDVIVAGESAGSAPTPLYAGLAHDLLPAAEITVVADGSGAYPDVPALNALIGGLWGVSVAVPPWPENAGLTPEQWSLPGLFVQAHKHDPDIVFGRHDYAYDAVQKFFGALAGVPGDELVKQIDGTETEIEQGGVDLHSYIAPGQSHTVLSKPDLYTETVGGVALIDWITDLLRRRPEPDVHCVDCQPPG